MTIKELQETLGKTYDDLIELRKAIREARSREKSITCELSLAIAYINEQVEQAELKQKTKK